MTGFPAVVAATERSLVAAVDLAPLALPPELARAEGTWKGRVVLIETTAWAGGAVAYARFARVWQPDAPTGEGLSIGNVLALGRPEHALPVLGADLVATGARGRTMLAADLSPTLPPGPERDAQLVEVARAAADRPALPTGGDLPEWCARFFSPHALFARPEPSAVEAAVAIYGTFPDAFTALALAARADARGAAPERLVRHVERVQLAYLAAHRTDDPGLAMLARIFGEGWSRRYVDEVLFPEILPERPASR